MAIDLQKGQRINLKKENGSDLQNVCVGVNWGVIEKKGWFGGVSKEAVDFCMMVQRMLLILFFSEIFFPKMVQLDTVETI